MDYLSFAPSVSATQRLSTPLIKVDIYENANCTWGYDEPLDSYEEARSAAGCAGQATAARIYDFLTEEEFKPCGEL